MQALITPNDITDAEAGLSVPAYVNHGSFFIPVILILIFNGDNILLINALHAVDTFGSFGNVTFVETCCNCMLNKIDIIQLIILPLIILNNWCHQKATDQKS